MHGKPTRIESNSKFNICFQYRSSDRHGLYSVVAEIQIDLSYKLVSQVLTNDGVYFDFASCYEYVIPKFGINNRF